MAENVRQLRPRRSRRAAQGDLEELPPAEDPPAENNDAPAADDDAAAGQAADAAQELNPMLDDPANVGGNENVPLQDVGDEGSTQRPPSSDTTGSMQRLLPEHRRYRNWKCGTKVCVAVCAVSALFICCMLVGYYVVGLLTHSEASWSPWRQRDMDLGFPRILLWERGTRALHHMPHHWLYSHSRTVRTSHPDCPVGPRRSVRCEITDDPYAVIKSDAIVFYADKLSTVQVPLRPALDQLWVFWARDVLPPSKTKYSSSLPEPGLLKLFNLTMGHRDDADIVVEHETWRCDFPSDEPIRPAEHANATAAPKLRKAVAWILGQCEQERVRAQLDPLMSMSAAILRPRPALNDTTRLPLHLLWGCGKQHCASLAECVKHVAENFHFIMVSLLPECFQSSYEIIFSAFRYDLVPVVLAPEDAKLEVPDNSVITTAELHGPGELAGFLRELLTHPDRYESYFTWKRHCAFVKQASDLCPLCRHLWRLPDPIRRKTHPDVADWWTRRGTCWNEPLFGLDSAFAPKPYSRDDENTN